MIDVGAVSDIASGEMKRVDIGDRRLCLINVEDSFYVIDDTCTHADYSLSEGSLDSEEKEVECPKHGALFDITTGHVRSLPATRAVATYAVSVVDGRIFVEVDQHVGD